MKAKILVRENGYVELSYDDFDGGRTVTIYFVPQNGGYVRVYHASGNHYQVCEKLSTRGNTLMSTRENLPALIRAEWRKFKKAEYRDRIGH